MYSLSTHDLFCLSTEEDLTESGLLFSPRFCTTSILSVGKVEEPQLKTLKMTCQKL